MREIKNVTTTQNVRLCQVKCLLYALFICAATSLFALDADECMHSTKNTCQQGCVNLRGTYKCTCEPGFYSTTAKKDVCERNKVFFRYEYCNCFFCFVFFFFFCFLSSLSINWSKIVSSSKLTLIIEVSAKQFDSNFC